VEAWIGSYSNAVLIAVAVAVATLLILHHRRHKT
jgi:hypothetical protein